LFDTLGRQPIDFASVRKVRIALSEGAFKMHGGFGTYKAKFEALLSAHYTAAAILHDKALTLAQFEPSRYDDQKLRNFAVERVEVFADPSVSGSQAAVEIETEAATYSTRCEHPLGSYENPLSRAQIEEKFRTYAKSVLPDGAVADVIGAVNGLEHVASVRTLMAPLCGAPRAIAAE
jgi:2-methylcitrate dehydratase PrpD